MFDQRGQRLADTFHRAVTWLMVKQLWGEDAGITPNQTREGENSEMAQRVCSRGFFRATETDGSIDALLQSTRGAWTDAPGHRASGHDSSGMYFLTVSCR